MEGVVRGGGWRGEGKESKRMVIVKKKENKFDKILLVNYSVTLLISPIMPAIYKKKLRQYNSFLQFTLRQLIQKNCTGGRKI